MKFRYIQIKYYIFFFIYNNIIYTENRLPESLNWQKVKKINKITFFIKITKNTLDKVKRTKYNTIIKTIAQ